MSGMTSYFIRRLLFVPFTFIAITFLVYSILRYVPGGPIVQAEVQMRMSAMTGEAGGGGSSTSDNNTIQLDEEAMEANGLFKAHMEVVVLTRACFPVVTLVLEELGVNPSSIYLISEVPI